MNKKGFTLLEMIVVLLLVGILSAVAGMGIVMGIKGYLFAKENTPLAQKTQAAITRIVRELTELDNILVASPTGIVFENLGGYRAIALVGDQIKIREGQNLPDDSRGDILIDKVINFTLTYYKGNQTWTMGDNLRLLSRIKIDLTVQRTNEPNDTFHFSTEVNPRNTGTFNVPVQ